ncbi:MAG: class I SAM-dependent methyltransferase [Myxococcales bacterium]|nr:class I SAM-dependent methyltransferase [Myxococcales bacterium]
MSDAGDVRGAEPARTFFDEMAPHYDSDLVELGWDPIAVLTRWPFVVPPGAAVLDVGCATGATLEHLAGAARTLAGFDVSDEMLARARRRRPLRDAELRLGSAANPWPFPDDAFDRVVALAMLEFVPQLDFALDELARVLRPHGRAIVSVEDVCDMGGIERERHELRYDELPLWRRTRDDLELCVPPGLELVRVARLPGYTVLERGFTCAYWIAELCAREA